jgi:hypothetical protein
VRRIQIHSDPDLPGRLQIWILALINNPTATFLVCVKAINTLEISVFSIFGPWRQFKEHIDAKKHFQKKIGRKFIKIRIRIRIWNRIRTFLKVGSGSGQKSSESATLLKTDDSTVYWSINMNGWKDWLLELYLPSVLLLLLLDSQLQKRKYLFNFYFFFPKCFLIFEPGLVANLSITHF